MTFDAKTSKILEDTAQALLFDDKKLKKEEAFDGYSMLITSEDQEADERIIDIYRSLWKFKESFKVSKSDLETRPVYLFREDHIQGHFLTSFVSLVIARLLERRMKGKVCHHSYAGQFKNSLLQSYPAKRLPV